MASSHMSMINAVAVASAHQAILQVQSRIQHSSNTINDIEKQINVVNGNIISNRDTYSNLERETKTLYRHMSNEWKRKQDKVITVYDTVSFKNNTMSRLLQTSLHICKSLIEKVSTFKTEYEIYIKKENETLQNYNVKVKSMDDNMIFYNKSVEALNKAKENLSKSISEDEQLQLNLQWLKSNVKTEIDRDKILTPKLNKTLETKIRFECKKENISDQVKKLTSTLEKLAKQLENTELAGKDIIILFRRLKKNFLVATEQHSVQSKTTEEAKTKLHTIYKVTSQIESIENHLATNLIPKYEAAFQSNIKDTCKLNAVAKQNLVSEEKIDEKTIELYGVKKKYVLMKNYVNYLNGVNIDELELELTALNKDLKTMSEFRNAITSNKLFPDSGIDEECNINTTIIGDTLIRLPATATKQDINLTDICNMIGNDKDLFLSTSLTGDDSENKRLLTEKLKKISLEKLMDLSIKTQLLYTKERGKQKNLNKQRDIDNIDDITIIKAQWEEKVKTLETETSLLEKECKIMWDNIK